MSCINFSEGDLYCANTADLVSYLEGWGECMKKFFSHTSTSTLTVSEHMTV